MTTEHVETIIAYDTTRTAENAAEIREDLKRFHRDSLRLVEMREELLDEFEDQWVAMYEGTLFASRHWDDLIEALQSSGVDTALVALRFMTRMPRVLVHAW